MRVRPLSSGAYRLEVTVSKADKQAIQKALTERLYMDKLPGGEMPGKSHDDADRAGRALAEICREWLMELEDEEDDWWEGNSS